jgi:hypothetical protein
MKNIKNFKKEELSAEKLHRICGGESTETETTTASSNTKVVNVGNSIVDDLNGLIR